MFMKLCIGLLAGLVASPHCAGMCGAFPLHLAQADARGRVLARLLAMVAAKCFTYAFLGALAGFGGDALVRSLALADSQSIVAWAAGAIMVLFGLAMLGLKLPSLSKALRAEAGLLAGFYRGLFRSPGVGAAAGLGLLMGFLPCPATLAMLAAAGGSQSVLDGMAIMLGFGLGSSPVLAAMGLGGSAVFGRFRRIGLRLAGAIVLALGLMTALRGSSLIEKVCPACHQEAAPDGSEGAATSEDVPCEHCLEQDQSAL